MHKVKMPNCRQIAGILRERDLSARRSGADKLGDRFKCGVIVYAGEQTIPLGDRLYAVPVSGLWTGSQS